MADYETFEALVLEQRPATQSWAPVTDYSFEARKAIEGKHPQLICDYLVPCEDADILDVGCGPGCLVRLLWEEGARREWQMTVRGCDLSPQAGHPWFFPLNVASRVEDNDIWDLVICREVLEHLTLRQIRQAVTNLCALSSRYVYVTTRFSSEHDIWRVDTSDDLDPTHITIPSKDLIRLLFVLEGFRRRADLEARMDWQGKNRCLVYERAA